MFGHIVREHRHRLGVSQQELAGKTGISVRSIGKIEAGRIVLPRPATVRLLADAFGLHGADRERFCRAAAGSEPVSPLRDPTPAQLPPDVQGFTGRTLELGQLDALLHTAVSTPSTMVIAALFGTAGVGKTALAVHWARRVAGQFPDGQLYVNLRGFDPSGQAMDSATAVRGFLDALGVPPQRVPTDPVAQAALYRSLLTGRRMLILLDNARDTAQARPLLPGAAGCLVVVTSRSQLTGLVAANGAHPLTLDLLSPEQARELLAHRLGVDRIAAEPGAVDEIVARCARLPLALTLVAAHAAIRPHTTLLTLADELRDAQGRWQALASDDPTANVRTVFSWSYEALPPDAARLFRLLGLHPGPDVTAAAAASLAAVSPTQVRPLLAELARANLVAEHQPGRYALHDLLRAYAADLVHRVDPPEERHSATHRMLDYYLHTAAAADQALHPSPYSIALQPAQPGVTAEHLTDHEQALDWFSAERAVLLTAVHHAAATGFDAHVGQLSWALRTFLDRRGHWDDQAVTARAAVAATERLADPSAQAQAHLNLAYPYSRLGRFDKAHVHVRRALDLVVAAGDQPGQAFTHHVLAHLWQRQGNVMAALDHAGQALTLFEATGDEAGQADGLNQVGWCYAHLGDHQQAITYCRHALALFQKVGHRAGQAETWDNLGYAYDRSGHHAEALGCYEHALDLYRELGARYDEAAILRQIGDTYHATGDRRAARDAWQRALTILTDLDHPDADTVRARLVPGTDAS